MNTPQKHGSASATGPAEAADDDVRRRLVEALKEHSHSDIARKLGVPRPNVYRYLTNARIPAGFCSLVSREYGLNPVWLLTGEGAPHITDVTRETNDTAGDLLELVQAMSAVAQMRLGTLVGKEHLKTLRRLNDNLAAFESIRTKVDQQTRSFLARLLDDIERLLQQDEFSRAAALLGAVEQALRLCFDEALRRRALRLKAEVANEHGDYEAASQLRGELFLREFADPSANSKQRIVCADRFASTLTLGLRVREAQRVCRSVLELCADAADTSEYRQLEFTNGLGDVMLGDMHTAGPKIMRGYGWMPDPEAKRHILVSLQLCTGGTTFAAELDRDAAVMRTWSERARQVHGGFMLYVAGWFEDAALLRRACALYCPDEGEERGISIPYIATWARCLRDVLATGKPGPIQRFLKHPQVAARPANDDRGAGFGVAVCLCQLYRLAGSREQALREMERAERALAASPPELSCDHFTLAYHSRNVIELVPQATRSAVLRAAREHALQRFADFFAKGNLIFAKYVPGAAGPTV